MDIVNYYADLGIEDDHADEATIKKAYRKLVLKWHPDKHPENRDEAETQIRKINNAYEVLSNPTKRSTYDDQRRAVKRKKQGFGPPPPSGAPRMRIPKEFMMMPIGFPDRFVRYSGRRLFVHSRKDDPDVEFKAFFEDTKWSLWWLPEVNNMCRVRALGSRAAGEKMGVAAGLCGGLNLSFFIDPASPTDSEVGLEDARKGEKVDKVNFIAVTSPAYEGAFRFEAAYRKGFYLIFFPPNHLRVAPYGEEDDRGIADFTLVDFGVMFKFIEMEEVLQPAVAAYQGWVKLEQLRKDPNIVLYFSNILQKPVWDNEDFIIYFEGHWETWEFNKETQSVRLRTKQEKLAQLLASVKDIDGVSAVVAGAKDELTKLPLPAAARALVVLAASTHDGEGLDVTKTINRIAAQKKLLSNLRSILSTATNGGEVVLPLHDLLDMADLAAAVGGPSAASDLVHTRQADGFSQRGETSGHLALKNGAGHTSVIDKVQLSAPRKEELIKSSELSRLRLNGVQLQPARLLDLAAVALKPQLGTLPAADVIKLVLAVAGDGRSDLLEAAAEEAIDRRISGFPPAQLLVLSQGVVAGLGAKHSLVERLAEFWAETVKDWTKGAGGGWDSDDEVTKQRKELERKSRLSADQVVQLAKVTAPAGSKVLTDAIGANLIARVKELTESGRKAVEAQLETGALAEYSRKDRLKRAV
ncbi:DnaJ homolog subfamily B member 6 [Durusdinium trenchii]|uniref:DnaJ homolog subfamily B member 6 n=1 Tax=Durusdinium trenchii TaxID=1381693 RepID=A0ABP0P3U5_9DINO